MIIAHSASVKSLAYLPPVRSCRRRVRSVQAINISSQLSNPTESQPTGFIQLVLNQALRERLFYDLPVTRALISALGEADVEEVDDYLDNLLLDIEVAIDQQGIREISEMVHFLVVSRFMNDNTIDELAAQQLFDALILDKVINAGISSRVSITSFGRATVSKSRLSRTIGEAFTKTPPPSGP